MDPAIRDRGAATRVPREGPLPDSEPAPNGRLRAGRLLQLAGQHGLRRRIPASAVEEVVAVDVDRSAGEIRPRPQAGQIGLPTVSHAFGMGGILTAGILGGWPQFARAGDRAGRTPVGAPSRARAMLRALTREPKRAASPQALARQARRASVSRRRRRNRATA